MQLLDYTTWLFEHQKTRLIVMLCKFWSAIQRLLPLLLRFRSLLWSRVLFIWKGRPHNEYRAMIRLYYISSWSVYPSSAEPSIREISLTCWLIQSFILQCLWLQVFIDEIGINGVFEDIWIALCRHIRFAALLTHQINTYYLNGVVTASFQIFFRALLIYSIDSYPLESVVSCTWFHIYLIIQTWFYS